MMTVDDALAIDAVLQCIYGVLRLICRGKSSQPHYADSDLSTTHWQHHDPQAVQTPAREASRGFL